MRIYGLDFTCVPSSRKPITCVECILEGQLLQVRQLCPLTSLDAFEEFLSREGPWVAGIDFPFGQPRKLIENMLWPQNSWEEFVGFISQMSLKEFDKELRDYREERPKGDKQHLRSTDKAAGAKSAMMMYGVPVGKMFFRGAPILAKSGVCIFPCMVRNSDRIVLEAYPGIIARRWTDGSYKGENPSKDDVARKRQREKIIHGILSQSLGEIYGIELQLGGIAEETFISDSKGGHTRRTPLCHSGNVGLRFEAR